MGHARPVPRSGALCSPGCAAPIACRLVGVSRLLEVSSDHSAAYLAAAAELANAIDPATVEEMVQGLAAVRDRGGRLFIVGVGGGAGHASHAVNDFRKLCRLESYAPSDNVSELTARTNDDGWDTTFAAWLRTSRLDRRDAV